MTWKLTNMQDLTIVKCGYMEIWPEGRREYDPGKFSNNVAFLPRVYRAFALTPSPLGVPAVSQRRFLSPCTGGET